MVKNDKEKVMGKHINEQDREETVNEIKELSDSITGHYRI